MLNLFRSTPETFPAPLAPYFTPCRLVGTGAYQPPRRVMSSDLDRTHHVAHGTVERRSGVRERAFATEGMTAAFMGAAAAREALDAAGLGWDGIDVLVCANATPDQALPYNGALLHAELDAPSRVPAVDVNMSCLSFLAALDLVADGLTLGKWRRALIVSADLASAGIDASDPESAWILGDGAAAAVLERVDGPIDPRTSPGLLGRRFTTHHDAVRACRIEGGGSRHPVRHWPADSWADKVPAYGLFHMDGPGLFRAVIKPLDLAIDDALAQAVALTGDVTLNERKKLGCVIPHQASGLALQHAKRRLGFDADRVVDVIATHGNQVAASLPTALHHARLRGWTTPGSTGLIVGTSAGASVGAVVLRW